VKYATNAAPGTPIRTVARTGGRRGRLHLGLARGVGRRGSLPRDAATNVSQTTHAATVAKPSSGLLSPRRRTRASIETAATTAIAINSFRNVSRTRGDSWLGPRKAVWKA
jgi:hypothetical protein